MFTLRRKILLFYSFILLNQLGHEYELYTRVFSGKIGFFSATFFFVLAVQIFLYGLLVIIGLALFRDLDWGYRAARFVAVIYLIYGLIFGVASVYRAGNVPGNFTGFIFVMICLPLLLQISDFLKLNKNQTPPQKP